MHAVEVDRPDRSPIEVDVCLRCHWVWLDEGELAAAPSKEASFESNTSTEVKPLSPEVAKAWQAFALDAQQREREYQDFDGTPHFDNGWQMIPYYLGFPVVAGERVLGGGSRWGSAVLFFLFMVIAILVLQTIGSSQRIDVFRTWGLIPEQFWRLGGTPVLTSFFLHPGWILLLVNLYFFAMVSADVETRLGAVRLFGLLGYAALGAAVSHSLLSPSGEIPLIGASGAFSGLLAYWVLTFPQRRVHLFTGFVRRRVAWLRSYTWSDVSTNVVLPARVIFFLWVFLQWHLASLHYPGVASASVYANLGGAAVGLALWSASQQAKSGRVRAIEHVGAIR